MTGVASHQSNVFDLSQDMIRRKVLKVFGGSFHIYDGELQAALQPVRLSEAEVQASGG